MRKLMKNLQFFPHLDFLEVAAAVGLWIYSWRRTAHVIDVSIHLALLCAMLAAMLEELLCELGAFF